MQIDPNAFFGPFALVAGAIVAVPFLVRWIQRSDDLLHVELRGRAERAEAREAVAIAGWREQTAATNGLADEIERDRQERSSRVRRTDRARV